MRTAKREIRQAYTKGNYTSNTGLQLTFEQLNNAEKQYIQGLQQAKANTAENGDARYSPIKKNSKGKYVQADRQVITSANPSDWEGQIYDYINNKIRNGQDVVIPTDDGDSLTITEKTAWKMGYRNEYDTGNGKQPISDGLYRTKINAAAHIDELAEISKRGNKNVTDTKNHDFAQAGFNYRTAYFRDLDGQYYKLTISVGENSDGKTVYNIGKIKRTSFPDITAQRQRSNNAPSAKGNSKNSISETNGNVNRFSIKEGNEYTPDKIARRLINENNAKGRVYVNDVREGIKELAGMVGDVFGDPTQVEGKYPEFEAKARTLAEEIAYASKVTNDEKRELYIELRDFLKGTRIKITNELRSDIPDFNNYRKSLMGTLVLSNDGVPMDVLYCTR